MFSSLPSASKVTYIHLYECGDAGHFKFPQDAQNMKTNVNPCVSVTPAALGVQSIVNMYWKALAFTEHVAAHIPRGISFLS